MGDIVKVIPNSHWYSRTGIPTYEVPYADPKKAGEFRATSLKDARTMDLLPSVTNILDVKAKPALIAWKVENAIVAALTTPQPEGMEVDEFAKLVADEANSVARNAADFGTRVHQSIEDYLVNNERPTDPEIAPYFENWLDWAMLNLDLEGTLFAERIVVGDGYAGRADLKCRALLGSPFYSLLKEMGHNPDDYGIIDFKTRKWVILPPGGKKKTAAPYYDEDGGQLAAYVSADIAMATTSDDVEPASWCASIFIHSADSKADIQHHIWDKKEMGRFWGLFRACQELWVIDKQYDPRVSI